MLLLSRNIIFLYYLHLFDSLLSRAHFCVLRLPRMFKIVGSSYIVCMHIVNVCLNYVHEQHRSPSSFSSPFSLNPKIDDRLGLFFLLALNQSVQSTFRIKKKRRKKTSNTINVFHRSFDCLMRWIKLLVTLICRVWLTYSCYHDQCIFFSLSLFLLILEEMSRIHIIYGGVLLLLLFIFFCLRCKQGQIYRSKKIWSKIWNDAERKEKPTGFTFSLTMIINGFDTLRT